jgi:AcrR family transcriptional regulator
MASTAASRTEPRRRARRGEGPRLEGEILDATEQLLLGTGSAAAVSINDIAAAVGVTPPSIYRHFADKTDLVFEACTRHFGGFEAFIRERCEGIDDPVEKLTAMGRAYVEFGIANPEPYRLMFMTRPDSVPHKFQGEMLAESGAFELLVSSVQACIEAGRFRPGYDDVYELAIGFWARVHGLTSLLISKPGIPWPDDPDFLDHFADQCLYGVAR